MRVAATLEQDARMAVGARMSLLLIGEAVAALETIHGSLPPPVVAASGQQPLVLPDSGWSGTLLIYDVDSLNVVDQVRLLDWMGSSHRNAQIVSTATASLLSRMRRGEFLEPLYYRLNMVCVDVAAGASDRRTGVSVADRLADGAWFEWPPRL